MDFKDRIKKVRGELTQKNFALRLGVHEGTIQLYEGGNIPKGDILLRINRKFNINIHWLLTGQGPMRVEGVEYGQDDIQPAPSGVNEPAGESGLSTERLRLVKLVIDILNSGTVYETALISNIVAFHRAIEEDRDLKLEIEECKGRLKALEIKAGKPLGSGLPRANGGGI